MRYNSSDHVSNIFLTPFLCSLSNDPLNLFCPSFQPILLRLHNSLWSGVSITAFGTEGVGGIGVEVREGRRKWYREEEVVWRCPLGAKWCEELR